jgi:hypothetical protein
MLEHLLHKQNEELVVRRQNLVMFSDDDGVESRVLENPHTLASYGVVNDSTLQIVMSEKLGPIDSVHHF